MAPNAGDAARSAGKVYQLVSEFTTPIIVGLLVDWQFGAKPWGTIVGTVLGLSLGGFRVVQYAKQEAAADQKGPPK